MDVYDERKGAQDGKRDGTTLLLPADALQEVHGVALSDIAMRKPMTREQYFKSLAAKRKEHPFTRKVANGVYLY